MIKKLQSLKKKKGFTLVELIVVIAIIGVLAAILVPTMLNYVTSSRVTSANSTAASIKNNIDAFLTNADTAGYGMRMGDYKQTLYITVDPNSGDAKWTVSQATGTNFKSGASGVKWGTAAGSAVAATAKNGNVAETLLAVDLRNLFPEIKSASIIALLVGGKCVGVAYTADQATSLTAGTDCPGIDSTTGAFSTTFSWDKKTAGVSSSGLIVGTAPAIGMV